MVTTHLRVHAKNLFACFSYNLFNLVIIQKKTSGIAIVLKKKRDLKDFRKGARDVLIRFHDIFVLGSFHVGKRGN